MVTNKNINIELAITKLLNHIKKGINYEVFIQKMISDCGFLSVITTCYLSNQALYYVINYFDGKDTAATTRGKANSKNYYQFKYYTKSGDKKFSRNIKLATKLEKKFNNNYLDIEFGFKKGKFIYFKFVQLF